MNLPRIVAVETLDRLPANDPAARGSRRDLRRVHRAMGTRSILSQGWRRLVSPQRALEPLRILELGAGDGSLLLGLARSFSPAWPHVQLSLLDRQNIVTPATLSGFAELGWSAQVQVTDVLAWADRADQNAAQDIQPRWDLITCSLFLHHFEGKALERVLAAASVQADRFFACEPGRTGLALAASHLVALLGANAVTRQDAVLSVHAGFRGHEITRHWPSTEDRWAIGEGSVGLFSHSFSALRQASDRC